MGPLHFFSVDPFYRGSHLKELAFGIWYAWTENFILPFSQDEVVHLILLCYNYCVTHH
jgi:1,4-alpha-glucan branching enzyme